MAMAEYSRTRRHSVRPFLVVSAQPDDVYAVCLVQATYCSGRQRPRDQPPAPPEPVTYANRQDSGVGDVDVRRRPGDAPTIRRPPSSPAPWSARRGLAPPRLPGTPEQLLRGGGLAPDPRRRGPQHHLSPSAPDPRVRAPRQAPRTRNGPRTRR